MRAAIMTQFGFPTVGGTWGLDCFPCAHGDNMGAIVRLAFHDAAGGDGALARGSNGCIDFAAVDNTGLTEVIAQLDAAHAPFTSVVSRADFWVLAASVAIEVATTLADGVDPLVLMDILNLPSLPSSGPLKLPVRFGRVDAGSCTNMDMLIPPASFSWAQIVLNFNRFGITTDETVALFGAHAVGRAETANLGFNGGWTKTQSSFSNRYYYRLSQSSWTSGNPKTSNVWLNGCGGSDTSTLMLKTDVELGVTPSEECAGFNPTDLPSATPHPEFAPIGASKCPINVQAKDTVMTFKHSMSTWWATFRSAWAMVTQLGYTVDATSGRLVPSP